MVELSPFPRVSRNRGRRVGFTRDESATGMCLGVDCAEKKGALLRVTVRGANGRPTLDRLARVVWSRPRSDGRYWLGLEFVADSRKPKTVRRPRSRGRPSKVSA